MKVSKVVVREPERYDAPEALKDLALGLELRWEAAEYALFRLGHLLGCDRTVAPDVRELLQSLDQGLPGDRRLDRPARKERRRPR